LCSFTFFHKRLAGKKTSRKSFSLSCFGSFCAAMIKSSAAILLRTVVAEHDRELLAREKRITAPGHHQPLNRKKAHQGISMEEQTLIGQHDSLDRYVAELKKQARGRA
jgi:hypothetical protein